MARSKVVKGSKPTKKKTNSRSNLSRELKKEAQPDVGSASGDFPIVGVGASAGGLEAFEQLLAGLPGSAGMALVLIPHLAPKHESLMTELLSKHSKLPVTQVTDGTPVVPNHVYVIPPNADIRIEKSVLYLSQFSESPLRRMPIDHFMRSLAQDQQNRAIGVVLSGTASDGTLGLQAIKAQGGITFAQDDRSAKYNAMPRSAVAAGVVDFILPPELIALELVRISRHVKLLTPPGSDVEGPADEHLASIFVMLRTTCHVDFSLYKQGTIRRRIARRMFLRKLENLEDYVRFLKSNKEELEALFHDILINVTGFFRDPEAFETLKSKVFPVIMAERTPNAPIRFWVPGCSTGEEAYSLAIALLEYLGQAASTYSIQIFATDVSETIIQRARNGIYPENISIDVTPERLRRFFQRVEGGFQISKSIRDICVFAKQDLTRDPPFSKLDIISCRNVMIYMNHVLQKRIVPLFHYALNPNGMLFLGASETVGSFNELFNTVDKKYKIYSKRPVPVAINFDFATQLPFEEKRVVRQTGGDRSHSGNDFHRIADQILLNRYAPASIVVNQNLDIVQFIGNTGPYMSPSPGDASLNLVKMVKPSLNLELRIALQKMKSNKPIRREGILVEFDSKFKAVNFEVIPIHSGAGERHSIIVFEETSPDSSATGKVSGRRGNSNQKSNESQTKANQAKTRESAEAEEINRLREELEARGEYLQSIIEEQRTTNEELRSANEEIQSSNEELQSINEELETAKEELQSTNEELTTVNEELQNRNEELTGLNNDLNNLLSSVSIPILMLGNDLRIRRFTPLAEKIMNLIPGDVGRPITDIKSNLKLDDLRGVIVDVIDTLKTEDREVEDLNGKWYSMRIRPYRTVDNKIDGVVLVLLDLPRPTARTDT